MQKKLSFSSKSVILLRIIALVLVAVVALGMISCKADDTNVTTPDEKETPAVEKSFVFEVTFADGETRTYNYKSSCETVGEVLFAEKMIVGEDGPYGLYVKTVDGVTLDYATDGMYWAFYVNGAYASSGVDKTPLKDGETYAFRAEK